MIDSELNNAILPLLKLPRVWIELDGGYWEEDTFDFNNWNDLMPLALKYGILYLPDNNGFIAYNNLLDQRNNVTNESPQRALAECLLKVLEAEKKL